MKPAYDLTGQQFGYWTALRRGRTYVHDKGTVVYWTCRCVCGVEKDIPSGHLRRSHKPSKSCGCMKVKLCSDAKIKHGHGAWRTGKISPTYWTWQAMLGRCTRPTHIGWKNYGGRGIKVCKRWLKFENFLADMGERPDGMTLDRKDNDGDYKKSNCRWATRIEQQANRRIKSTLQQTQGELDV